MIGLRTQYVSEWLWWRWKGPADFSIPLPSLALVKPNVGGQSLCSLTKTCLPWTANIVFSKSQLILPKKHNTNVYKCTINVLSFQLHYILKKKKHWYKNNTRTRYLLFKLFIYFITVYLFSNVKKRLNLMHISKTGATNTWESWIMLKNLCLKHFTDKQVHWKQVSVMILYKGNLPNRLSHSQTSIVSLCVQLCE